MLRSRIKGYNLASEHQRYKRERFEDQDDELQAELGTPTPPDVIAARTAARAKADKDFAAMMGYRIVPDKPTPAKDAPPQK